MSSAAKRTVAAVVAIAAVLVLAGGLRAMQVRQQREAENTRTRPVDTAASETPSAPAWPAVTPVASGATSPTVPLPGESASAPLVDMAATSSATSGVSGVSSDLETHGPVGGPTLPAGPARELPLGGPDAPGASIVLQANHALRRGATERALTLARQAVAANPADADAWLTLGAALQSSGDTNGAREAYNNCLARARTPNISECRLLLRRF